MYFENQTMHVQNVSRISKRQLFFSSMFLLKPYCDTDQNSQTTGIVINTDVYSAHGQTSLLQLFLFVIQREGHAMSSEIPLGTAQCTNYPASIMTVE